MAKKLFDKKLMTSILYDEVDGVEVIRDEIVDHSRWSVVHKLIFEYEDKIWSTHYSVGATEMQEEYPWEYEDKVECIEVEPVEKTITDYVVVRADG